LLEGSQGLCPWTKPGTNIQTLAYKDVMLTLKVIAVGTSSGVILPREALAKLHVENGDTLYLMELPDGGYRITPSNRTFAAEMQAAEDIMLADQEILRQLAK